MLSTRKQITLNGASNVTEDGKEITVATLFASVNEQGKLNITKAVINTEKYTQYSDIVDADMQEFEAQALAMLKEA